MKFVFHIYFCLKCIVIVLRSLYTSLLGMSEAILARELGLTSMRLQDSYLMIRSLESELETDLCVKLTEKFKDSMQKKNC